MTDLVLIVVVGSALLALVAFWVLAVLRKGSSPGLTDRQLTEVRATLGYLNFRLTPRSIVERVFSSEDWEFVSRHAPPWARKKFLRERKEIAIRWLKKTREDIGQLARVHRTMVQPAADISPQAEFSILHHYVAFVIATRVLIILISVLGPLSSKRAAGYAIEVSERLFDEFARVWAALDPEHLARIKEAWSPATIPKVNGY